ncbi:MAG: hypothetical protein KJP01_01775 [Gramella sp.]|nr:hypothetical protein [Christiangramia sp.]
MERLLYLLFALGILYACSTGSLFGDIQLSEHFSEINTSNTNTVANIQDLEINCSNLNKAFIDNSTSKE